MEEYEDLIHRNNQEITRKNVAVTLIRLRIECNKRGIADNTIPAILTIMEFGKKYKQDHTMIIPGGELAWCIHTPWTFNYIYRFLSNTKDDCFSVLPYTPDSNHTERFDLNKLNHLKEVKNLGDYYHTVVIPPILEAIDKDTTVF